MLGSLCASGSRLVSSHLWRSSHSFALVTRLVAVALYTSCLYLLTSTTFDSILVHMEGVTQDMPISHSPPQERGNPSAINVLSPSVEDKGPVPMSFPSILRNSGLSSRYAHLVGPTGSPTAPVQPKKVWRRNDNEGKRWVRRRENGASHFTIHTHSLLPPPPLAPQPKVDHPGGSTENWMAHSPLHRQSTRRSAVKA